MILDIDSDSWFLIIGYLLLAYIGIEYVLN